MYKKNSIVFNNKKKKITKKVFYKNNLFSLYNVSLNNLNLSLVFLFNEKLLKTSFLHKSMSNLYS